MKGQITLRELDTVTGDQKTYRPLGKKLDNKWTQIAY